MITPLDFVIIQLVIDAVLLVALYIFVLILRKRK